MKEKSLERYIDRSLYSDMGSQISTNNLSDFSIKFEEISDKFSQTDNEKSDEDKASNNNVNNFVYKNDDETAANFFNKLILSDQQRSKSVSNSNKLKINNFRKIFENAFNNETNNQISNDDLDQESKTDGKEVGSDKIKIAKRHKL
jgi:hypothetical protein